MILSTMQSFQPGIHDKQIHSTAQLQTVQQFVFADASAEQLQRLPQVDVVGDKYRLRQVLANFLSNAIKFTPTLGNVHVSLQILPATPPQTTHALRDSTCKPSTAQPGVSGPSGQSAAQPHSANGGPQHAIDILGPASSGDSLSGHPHGAASGPLSVSWPAHVSSAATFRISVRDTGVGVSEADQKKLFSPYMQILPGELQKGAGTGLGLSISQNLIRIHGGQIGYTVPDDGRGSEFYMEVPMEMLYRQPAGSAQLGHSSTPNTSLRLMDGSEGKDGSLNGAGGSTAHGGDDGQDGGAVALGAGTSDLDDDNDEPAIGVLPAAEDRQEEDAFIREIADLQLQQHSRARVSHMDDQSAAHSALEPPLSLSSSSSSSFSSSTSRALSGAGGGSSAAPLYVSRPALASPDSSMRILAQQRMHAQHLRQSAPAGIGAASGFSAATLSPSLQHSSRRLLALARQPTVPASAHDGGNTPSSAHGEDSVISSGAVSVSSRSVSLVMNDAHGPAASPLLYKRSPITLTRRVMGLQAAAAGGSPLAPSALSLPALADDDFIDGAHSASDESHTSPAVTASVHPSHPLALHGGVASSLLTSTILQQQRRALGSVLADGGSPATVRSNSSPILSLLSSASSAGGVGSGGTAVGSGGSSAYASPSARSDVYITLATYGLATKASRPAATGNGISSRARDALSALAAAEAAAHSALPQPASPQHTEAAGDLREEPMSGACFSDSVCLSAASTTATASDGSHGSISASSASLDGCEPRQTPSSSTSASAAGAQHSVEAQATPNPQHETEKPTADLARIGDPPASNSSSSSQQPASIEDRETAAEGLSTSPRPQAQQSYMATALVPSLTTATATASTAPAASADSVARVPATTPTRGPAVPAASVDALVSSPPPPALRVLVAEDSVPNLKLLLVLLRKCKVEAVGVENGQLAVDAFHAYAQQLKAHAAAAQRDGAQPQPPFDLVLMDGNMPILGGIEATRQLRALGVTIPIYAVTGNAMAEDTAAFLRAGANEPVLTKPVQQKELHRILQQHAAEVRKAWRARQQVQPHPRPHSPQQ